MIDLDRIAIWITVNNPETDQEVCHQRTIREIVTNGSIFELNYLRDWICEVMMAHEFSLPFDDFCWEINEEKAQRVFEFLINRGVKLDSCILGDLNATDE